MSSTTSSSPHYTTTVYLPPSVTAVHPTDHSPPPVDPPAAARTHDKAGAAAFAAWYFRWFTYAYVAKTSAPLSAHSIGCAACSDVVGLVDQAVAQHHEFRGENVATSALQVTQSAPDIAKVLIKGSSTGFTLYDDAGNALGRYSGGDQYTFLIVEWRHGEWFTVEVREMA